MKGVSYHNKAKLLLWRLTGWSESEKCSPNQKLETVGSLWVFADKSVCTMQTIDNQAKAKLSKATAPRSATTWKMVGNGNAHFFLAPQRLPGGHCLGLYD